MGLFLKFEGSFSSRYNLDMFAAYHAALQGMLAEQGSLAELAHVPDEKLAAYETVVRLMEERNRSPLTDPNTQKSDTEESERDRILSLLFYFIANSLTSANKEVREAARRVEIALRNFKKIRYETDNSETLLIGSLLLACEAEELQPPIEKLGIRPILDDLAEANERFRTIKEQRIRDRYARRQQMKAHEMRRQAEALWAEIQELIHASGVIASATPGAEAQATAIEELIRKLNAIIVNYRTSWRQSKAQKQAHRERQEEEGEGDEPK